MLMKYLKVHIGISLLDILLHLLLQGWMESSLIAYTNIDDFERIQIGIFFFWLWNCNYCVFCFNYTLYYSHLLLKFLFDYVLEVLWYSIIFEIIGGSFDNKVVLWSYYRQGMVATIMHDVCLIKCLKNLHCTLSHKNLYCSTLFYKICTVLNNFLHCF